MGVALGPIDDVRVFTHDLALARRFYRRGLGLTERTAGPGYALFTTGGADLVLEQVERDDGDELVGRVVGFSFTVEDCAATCDALAERGVQIVRRPERQPSGGVLAFVEDPDGNLLTLVQRD